MMVGQFSSHLFTQVSAGLVVHPAKWTRRIFLLHDKEQVDFDQSALGPNFNGRKNDCSQYVRGTVLFVPID
jgi:hypothetical protein